MKVIEGCRVYELADGQRLRFVGPGSPGTTNEELIEVLVDRIGDLNTVLPCRENSLAITKLEEALLWLRERARRTADGGT